LRANRIERSSLATPQHDLDDGSFSVVRNFPGKRFANPGDDMPYTRPIRRFYLTPPSIAIFVASLILAILAVLAVYGKLSIFNASYAFLVLLIAYLLLLAGNLFRGV
jgi:hypothetical protein